MSRKNRTITILGIVAILAITTAALAGWGRGSGRMGGGNSQWGGCPYAGNAQGYNSNLSAEELEKLNADRLAFYEETEELRRGLYQKGLELRSELAKKSPDAKKAAELQGDISKLQGEMSQKRLAFQLKAGDQGAGTGRGYGGRSGRGGRGGVGGGNGPRGGGFGCW